jgi:hypothetical protein
MLHQVGDPADLVIPIIEMFKDMSDADELMYQKVER